MKSFDYVRPATVRDAVTAASKRGDNVDEIRKAVEALEKVIGKGWAQLAELPWIATPAHSGHRRLLDDIFSPLGALPKRVAYTDQEEAMIDFVESGICLSLARDSMLAPRLARPHHFVVADRVKLTCDLSFACLASRRHEPAIAHAFAAVRAVWNIKPAIAGAGAARTRKVAKSV